MAKPESPPPVTETTDSGTASTSADEHLLTLHHDFEIGEIFTAAEVDLVQDLMGLFDSGEAGRYAADLREALDQGFRGLGAIAMSFQAYPPLRDAQKLGGQERSGETLLRKLLETGGHAIEWSLPTKALLSRTFGIAKVNFWTSIRYVVQVCESEAAQALLERIKAAIEEAVYTRLAEELYGSFVASRTTSPEVKRMAVESVIDLWEGRVDFATDRFCPILRSAWAARCRAPRIFGTLMGTTEIFQLLFKDCDPIFVEWFTNQEHDSEQVVAFEEFLFDLPFESLERIRMSMKEEGRSCVGPTEVERYLGIPKGGLRPLIEDPKALYSSFRQRRVKAQYRTSMRIAGPKRTAEAYLLEGLLREQLERKQAEEGAA